MPKGGQLSVPAPAARKSNGWLVQCSHPARVEGNPNFEFGRFSPVGRYPVCITPAGTALDSDLVRIGTGSVSFTPICTPRHQGLGLSQHSILGTRLNQWKGSGICGNGSGRHATNSCSARHLRGSSTLKHSSPTLCLFVQWHMTSTLSERECMFIARGCAVTRSGHHASLGQVLEWTGTLLSGTSFSFYRVAPTTR